MRPVSPVRDVAEERLELLDWKRRIFDLYREVRADDDPTRAWNSWRTVRDDLMANHSQSPVDQLHREDVTPSYFDYDPAARALARVEPLKLEHAELPMSRDDGTHFTRFGNAVFELHGSQLALGLYWLEAYGGGVFLSFTDETSCDLTYGAGRYLLDTVKAPISGPSTASSCSTSTSPSTRRVPTTRSGPARLHHPRTASRSRSAPVSDARRSDDGEGRT